MRPLIDHLLSKLRPKIRALARLKYVYNRETLMSQFKTHIWGHLEYHSGAIVMAKLADRRRLDKMQRAFLYDIGCTDTEAFVDYNLAPPLPILRLPSSLPLPIPPAS